MTADVRGARSVGTGGSRVRVGLVGEALQPARVVGVRAPTVRYQVRPHAPVGQIHQVEPGGARGKRKIDDTHEVAVINAVAMSFQGIDGAL